MSLAIQYETVEDAQMRLRGSVVLYDSALHYVETVEPAPEADRKEIFRVRALPLPLGKPGAVPIRKYISSRKFDLAPFPMGFLNTKEGAVFCSRSPARQQSQGLTSKTFMSEMIPTDPRVGKRGIDFSQFINSEESVKMLAGNYPSFKDACDKAKDGVSCAFAREFAISADPELPFLLYLYYKNTKVGIVVEGGVKIGPKRKCLKESLEERGVIIKE